MIDFFICLLITVMIHEFAHLLVALCCGIGVKAFSVGFGKPYLHKTIKGIDYRLSPLPFGGYCDLKGMDSKEEHDNFLAHPYRHKFLVLIAGVTVNVLLALGVYLVHFGSIKMGLAVDWTILKALFTQDFTMVEYIFRNMPINVFLLQLSTLNLFCGLSNLLPIVPLDGGLLWYYIIESKLSKGFKKWLFRFGWVVLIGGQFWLIYYICFGR